MSRRAYSAASWRVVLLRVGELVLRLTTKDRSRTRECVAQARAAGAAGARFFQIYLSLDDAPVEEWLRADERTALVQALEAEGWRLDEIGYVGEPVRDGFYGVVAPSGRPVAAIFTFTAAGLSWSSRAATRQPPARLAAAGASGRSFGVRREPQTNGRPR